MDYLKAMEKKFFLMEIFLKENLKIILEKGKANIFLKMEITMKENLKMVYKKAKVNFLKIVIIMKGNSKMD